MFYLDTLTVFVAVGPFTTSESDSYEPLIDFLKQVLQEEPDLVIMVISIYFCIQIFALINNCYYALKNVNGRDWPCSECFRTKLSFIMQTITSKKAVNIPPPPPLPLNSQSYSTHYAFLFQMGPFVDAKNDLIEVSLSRSSLAT